MHRGELELAVTVENTSWKGSRFYNAFVHGHGITAQAYGRSPNNAIRFALEKYTEQWKKVDLIELPEDEGTTIEIVEFTATKLDEKSDD